MQTSITILLFQGGGLLGIYGIILLKHYFGEYLDIDCCDIDTTKRDVITDLGATFVQGNIDFMIHKISYFHSLLY